MDKCPKCKSSWIGETIPEKDRHNYGDHTHFKREIAVEIQGQGDCIHHYECPDCGYEMPRADYDRAAEEKKS